jgi:hypothetical protein
MQRILGELFRPAKVGRRLPDHDELHVARAAEVTSLWRLGAAGE